MNLPKLKERRETLTVKYAKTFLTNNVSKNMFKLSQKKHNMKCAVPKDIKKKTLIQKTIKFSNTLYAQNSQ